MTHTSQFNERFLAIHFNNLRTIVVSLSFILAYQHGHTLLNSTLEDFDRIAAEMPQRLLDNPSD